MPGSSFASVHPRRPAQVSKLIVNARSNSNDIERNTAARISLDSDDSDNTIMCVTRAPACLSCNRPATETDAYAHSRRRRDNNISISGWINLRSNSSHNTVTANSGEKGIYIWGGSKNNTIDNNAVD